MKLVANVINAEGEIEALPIHNVRSFDVHVDALCTRTVDGVAVPCTYVNAYISNVPHFLGRVTLRNVRGVYHDEY